MTDTRPPDVITVAGHDLVDELIGQRTFTDMIHLVLTRTPTPPPGHREMIDALLVTLADHGVTPSSMAARLTLLGAPEAMQAAVAAGLCGAGSRFLGTLENAGLILGDALERHPGTPLPEIADLVVAEAKARREPVIGIGHPEHKHGDPRVPKLVALAEQHGVRGRAIDLLLEFPDALVRAGGPYLPVNGGGLCGAVVADMGYGPTFGRGIAVIARAAGLVGQLLDEELAPVARLLWDRERENPVG